MELVMAPRAYWKGYLKLGLYGIAGTICKPLEECNSEAGAKQHGCTDDVHRLKHEVRAHATSSLMSRSWSGSRNSSTVNRPMHGIAPFGSDTPDASFLANAMAAPQGMCGP